MLLQIQCIYNRNEKALLTSYQAFGWVQETGYSVKPP